MKLDSLGPGEHGKGVMESFPLVQKQLAKFVLLLFGKVAVHHSK